MLEGKSEKLEFQKMLSSPRRKNKNEQEQNKDDKKKGIKRNGKLKKWEEREMSEKTMKNDLSWNDPWLRSPWNTIWACLSFLSEPRTQAYITYLKSPFWLNVDTWTKEVFPWENFHNQQGCRPSSSTKNLDKSFTCLGWILNCQVHNGTVKKWWWKKEKMKMERKNKTLGWKPEKAI